MKIYSRSEYIKPCFLDVGSGWRWVVSFTLWPFYAWGNRSQFAPWIGDCIGRKSVLDDVKKKSFLTQSILGHWSPSHPVHSQLLYGLQYNILIQASPSDFSSCFNECGWEISHDIVILICLSIYKPSDKAPNVGTNSYHLTRFHFI
jgi:hypothetical protein